MPVARRLRVVSRAGEAMTDDFDVVRQALKSSMVGSKPDTLAALDRIEARLADAEEHIKHREDQLRARPEGLAEALFNAEAAAERLAEAARYAVDADDAKDGRYALRAALAAYEGKVAS